MTARKTTVLDQGTKKKEKTTPVLDKSDMEEMNRKYKELHMRVNIIQQEYDRLFEAVSTLRMLLKAFNALTYKGEVEMLAPAEGTPYWYIREMPAIPRYEVVPCLWKGYRSDKSRYTLGNMFLDKTAANMSCAALNEVMAAL